MGNEKKKKQGRSEKKIIKRASEESWFIISFIVTKGGYSPDVGVGERRNTDLDEYKGGIDIKMKGDGDNGLLLRLEWPAKSQIRFSGRIPFFSGNL